MKLCLTEGEQSQMSALAVICGRSAPGGVCQSHSHSRDSCLKPWELLSLAGKERPSRGVLFMYARGLLGPGHYFGL